MRELNWIHRRLHIIGDAPVAVSNGGQTRHAAVASTEPGDPFRRLHQPNAVALRIVNGDHERSLWRNTLRDALLFLGGRIGGQRYDKRSPSLSLFHLAILQKKIMLHYSQESVRRVGR